ncbi:MAG: hypothetical protein V1888_02825 [archaeon]
MTKRKTRDEIERIEKSRELDKFNYSTNVAVYLGGIAVLFALAKATMESVAIPCPEWWIYFGTFMAWSIITFFKNRKINLSFNKKSLMIDRRYEKLEVNISKLNKELKLISWKEIKEWYKKRDE